MITSRETYLVLPSDDLDLMLPSDAHKTKHEIGLWFARVDDEDSDRAILVTITCYDDKRDREFKIERIDHGVTSLHRTS